MGTTAIRTPLKVAQERDARKLITDLLGSLVFLMLVVLAAWIVLSSGAGHPTWL